MATEKGETVKGGKEGPRFAAAIHFRRGALHSVAKVGEISVGAGVLPAKAGQ